MLLKAVVALKVCSISSDPLCYQLQLASRFLHPNGCEAK